VHSPDETEGAGERRRLAARALVERPSYDAGSARVREELAALLA